MGRRVLLIGWDGADWKVITPLMDAGLMPNLERIVNRGVMGNLATCTPVFSPMLWTSIATGKRAFKHGILGFIEPDPATGGVRPVTNLSRKTRTIWNILNLEGMTSNVVGWWPSHPAEPIRGVMVSNRFGKDGGRDPGEWPMAMGTVHPPRLAERLAELRLHPLELSLDDMVPFVPQAAGMEETNDPNFASLARTIAENASVHAAATALVQLEPWDFMAVFYDGIDHYSHGFMRYHPPRMEGVNAERFELFRHVIEGAYRYQDMMLGVLTAAAGEDATVIVVSDHGFHPDELRPKGIPVEPAGPAVQHRAHGILAMAGPGIKRDERIYGASLLDITPTILGLYELPPGEDMDGAVLVNAFERNPSAGTVQSWDKVEGEDGGHPAEVASDPVGEQAVLDRLVDLGYVDAPDGDAQKMAREAARELEFNRAQALMDGRCHGEAVPILSGLVDAWPDEFRFRLRLGECYLAHGRTDESRALLTETIAGRIRTREHAHDRLMALMGAGTDAKQTLSRLERARLRADGAIDFFSIEFMQGAQCLAEGDSEGALIHLRNARLVKPDAKSVHVLEAQACLATKKYDRGREACEKALTLDPEETRAHVAMSRCLLGERRSMDAASAALSAIELGYFNPEAHYLLGTALHRAGILPRAVEALLVSLVQNPNTAEAHDRLAHIYDKRMANPTEASRHRKLASEARCRVRDLRKGALTPGGHPARFRKPPASDLDVTREGQDHLPEETAEIAETIVVVTGFPRSGTSMMMQMIAAGGFPVLADLHRPADAHNERGYYEYAPVKGTHRDDSWVAGAKGHAVKVVGPLILSMPRDKGYHYRVIFMQRDFAEIEASQRDMVRAASGGAGRGPERDLRAPLENLARRVRRVMGMSRMPLLYVDYSQCIEDPAAAAAKVNAFLGGTLNEGAMRAAVDPKLYHHRAGG